MIAQGVADIVESEGMGELGVKQRDDVAPGTEGARLFVDAMLAGKLGNEVPRNELADLRENRDPHFGWFFLNHQADPMWDRPPASSLFCESYGTAVLNFV